MVFGDDAAALNQVEIVTSGEKLQVRFKSSTGAPVNGNFTTFVGISEKYQVTLAETSSKVAVDVRTDSLNSTISWERSHLTLATFGAGNIFVSAPASLLYVPRITIETYGNGSVQMDVGKAWASQQTTFTALSKGSPSLSWFGDILHSAVEAFPSLKGKLCISTKYPVHGVTLTKNKDRAAYTGQTDFAKVKCEKRVLPERVPVKIRSTNPDEGATPIDSLAAASGSQVSGSSTASSTNSTQDKSASPVASNSSSALVAGVAYQMACVSLVVVATFLF